MADFPIAFNKTGGHEGGWVHDKEDLGKETYRGVAKAFHPDFPGWRIIDEFKALHGEGTPAFHSALASSVDLDDMVCALFKAEYWNPVLGDHIRDQDVANELYDTAVNMHPRRAVKFLQRALNALNLMGERWPDIRVDKSAGRITLGAYRSYQAVADRRSDIRHTMLALLNAQQGMHYLEETERRERQEKYIIGWGQRVFEWLAGK